MKYNETLILTTNSEILIPNYREDGEVETVCVEGRSWTVIQLSSSELIDLNLRLAGSSLRGARDSAEMILGTRNKAPVMMSRKHGTCWIPITWPDFSERGWLNALQVRHFLPNEHGTTTVCMKSGTIIDVPCSYYVFAKSMNKARELQSELDARDERIYREPSPIDQAFYVQKGEGLNYEVTDKVFYVAERKMNRY